jgi:hypothetical protein
VRSSTARSRTRSAEELAEALGIGKNQMYEALTANKVEGAFRFNRKWIIPEVVFDRILNNGGLTKILSPTPAPVEEPEPEDQDTASPEPKRHGRSVTFTCPADVHDYITALMKRSGRSQSRAIEYMLIQSIAFERAFQLSEKGRKQ